MASPRVAKTYWASSLVSYLTFTCLLECLVAFLSSCSLVALVSTLAVAWLRRSGDSGVSNSFPFGRALQLDTTGGPIRWLLILLLMLPPLLMMAASATAVIVVEYRRARGLPAALGLPLPDCLSTHRFRRQRRRLQQRRQLVIYYTYHRSYGAEGDDEKDSE